MGSRALTATALTFALLLGALTPALAQDGPTRAAAASEVATASPSGDASPGALTPLARPDRVELPTSQARTGADVVGGRNVPRGSHGFVALVLMLDRNGDVAWSCTGTVIRQRWVMTAAHCIGDAAGAAIATKVTRLDDLKSRHITFATGYAIAPSYRPRLGRNDVSLLKLEKPVTASPIMLAGKRDDSRRLTPGRPAKVLGWGAIDATTASDRMLQGRVFVVPNPTCKALFGSAWSSGRMLCAGSPTTDVCFGDSGGPLLIRASNRWIQHGVTNLGDGDCMTGDASVYTKASALRPWIERVTGLAHRP